MIQVSVVINTYNRAGSLRDTLTGLSQLTYPSYEVIVINGPSTDGTDAVLAEFGRKIKVGMCRERNLSKSRNIGIALASGQIVAFIDDDAVPSPGWLAEIVPLFDDPQVGMSGGRVLDHTGTNVQAHQIICDRFGGAEVFHQPLPDPPDVNFPFSPRFWSTLGTNALFRRSALMEVGGFDEEYDYFLDETDLCLRLNDRGWIARFSNNGNVYHRYRASHLRGENKAIRDWRSIIKNKAYFAFRFGLPYHSLAAATQNLETYCADARRSTVDAENSGQLPLGSVANFDRDIPLAVRTGIQRAGRAMQTSLSSERASTRQPWKAFVPVLQPEKRMHICYFSQDYPPGVTMGIGRVAHELAVGLARRGHVVHVIAKADTHHTVDFEDGVWVHRVPNPVVVPDKPAGFSNLPDHIWARCSAVHRELERIDRELPVDLVQMPNWDAEGLAVLLDGRWASVLGVYTPMKSAIQHNTAWSTDEHLQQAVLLPIAEAETYCYRNADTLLACGPAILGEVADKYGLSFSGRDIGLVPHGLPDLGAAQPNTEKGEIDLLFVGRLEERKGIDVLFDAIVATVDVPGLRFLIAGNDSLPAYTGKTWRETFEVDPSRKGLHDRVTFLGQVPDDELDALYRRCDIVVVPSRYESFGLPVIEGMMRARPVIAADIGGMSELVEHGRTGLLVDVGNGGALAQAIRRLATSKAERLSMGNEARSVFVERYANERMVGQAIEIYERVVSRKRAAEIPGHV